MSKFRIEKSSDGGWLLYRGYALALILRKGEDLAALAAAIGAKLEPQWIACSEQLPGELEYVLFVTGSDMHFGYYVGSTDITPAHWSYPNFTCGGECDASDVTHWMPLPSPPSPNEEPKA